MGVSKTMKLPSEFDLIPCATGTLPGRRWLVLAPHPDDESIACGVVTQKALSMTLPVRVV